MGLAYSSHIFRQVVNILTVFYVLWNRTLCELHIFVYQVICCAFSLLKYCIADTFLFFSHQPKWKLRKY